MTCEAMKLGEIPRGTILEKKWCQNWTKKHACVWRSGYEDEPAQSMANKQGKEGVQG